MFVQDVLPYKLWALEKILNIDIGIRMIIAG